MPANAADDLPELPAAVEDRLYEILFGAAPDEQAGLLDRLLTDHPGCRDALNRRLRSMTAGFGLLDRAGRQLSAAPTPSHIGPYRICELLGQGGFGVVYRAEQLEPVRRVVALKVLHPRRFDERSQWRFQTERQTLARMEHRNIAQMLDAGSTPDGLLFFAMEFVDGEPITSWCDHHRRDIEARLELFLAVCGAVQHAHQRGVVHRDLKPGNILVKTEGDTPVAKVIDFGVAKVLETDEVDALATRDGALIGTPAYMSPEQAAGQPVDIRTDVYALGVLLYELLAGGLPFPAENFDGKGIAEVARVVREDEPRRMTTTAQANEVGLDRAAASRGASPTALLAVLRGDLEWVVRRAMAKDPEQRYASVAGLIDDIAAYRRREPVSAREPEALYLLRRFVARHRLAVSVSTAIAVAILVVFVVLVRLLDEIDSARRTAVERGDAAEINGYAAHLAAANAALAAGDMLNARHHLDDAAPRHRGWEWRYLAGQCETSLVAIECPDGRRCRGVVWLDERRLCVLYLDGTVEVRDGDDGTLLAQPITLDGEFQDVCFDRSREHLVATVRRFSQVVAIDTRSWQTTALFDITQAAAEDYSGIRALTMAPDDRTVAISDNTGSVTLLDVDGERPPRLLCRTRPFAAGLSFTPDGERLVFGTMAGWIEVHRVADGELLSEVFLDVEGVRALALDAEGTAAYAATGLRLNKVDLVTGEIVARVPTTIEIRGLHRSADGRAVYGTGGWWTGRVTAWSAHTLELVGRYNGHRRGTLGLDQSPDGSRLATVSFDSARIWPARPARFCVQLSAGNHANDLAVARDGTEFCAVSRDGTVCVWDARTCELAYERACEARLYGCELTAKMLYVGGDRLLAIDRETDAIAEGRQPGFVTGRMCLDTDRRFLAASKLHGGAVCIWSVPELEIVHELELPVADRVEFDPASRCFLFSGRDGRLRSISPESGEVVVRPGDAGWDTLALRGGALAWGMQPLVYRFEADEALRALSPEVDVNSAVFSPDLQRLVTGSTDSLVRFWNPQGAELIVLDDAPKVLTELAFALGGERLVGLSQIQGAECYLMVWGTDAIGPKPAGR
ncbi:MAG: protein kinase [Planctomycetes bacterium]|nr:protein kinase [Planctomycetota bacterium]